MIEMSLSSGDLVRDLTGAPVPSPEGARRIPAGDPAMVLVRYPAAGRPCGRAAGPAARTGRTAVHTGRGRLRRRSPRSARGRSAPSPGEIGTPTTRAGRWRTDER